MWKIDKKIKWIFILIITDYLLTYFGIKIGYTEESNPLMKWLFELNIIQGLGIKSIFSISCLSTIHYMKKLNYKLYKKGINILLISTLGVVIYHAYIFYSIIYMIVRQ